MTMNDYLFLTLFSTLLTLLVFFRALYFRKTSYAYQQDLAAAQTTLEEARSTIENLKKVEKRFLSFQEDLHNASLTTKMQQSRLSLSNNTNSSVIPEKYRYVHSLSEKGLPSSDIASILTVSNREAEQLVALANLAQQ